MNVNRYGVQQMAALPKSWDAELSVVIDPVQGPSLAITGRWSADDYTDYLVLLRGAEVDAELSAQKIAPVPAFADTWSEVEGQPWLRSGAAEILAELCNARMVAWLAERGVTPQPAA